MSFSIKPLPAHAIIISTPHPDFDPGREMVGYVQDLRAALDRAPRPATFITVMDELEIACGDVTATLAGLTQGEPALTSHPNVKAIVVVTSSDHIPYETEKPEGPAMTITRTLAEAIAQAG